MICNLCKYKRLIEDGEDIEDVKIMARYEGFRSAANVVAKAFDIPEKTPMYKIIDEIKKKYK